MPESVELIYDEETSRNWSPDPDINALFIRNVFNLCHDRLDYRGHLFLNDVLDELGIDRTSRGQLIGWLRGVEGSMWECEWESTPDKEAGPTRITFHTQGEIYEKIES